jgi:hypothetical protein
MSLDQIKEKLLLSIKDELNTEENKVFIETEIIKPIVKNVLDQMYPYIIGTGLFFMSMFVFIMIILLLNIKVYMCT